MASKGSPLAPHVLYEQPASALSRTYVKRAVHTYRPFPIMLSYSHTLAKRSCADSTSYGEYSTHDFYGHHAAAASLAIVTGEAEAI
eukprot:2605899-Prymnesium_polylepis.1